MQPRGLPCPLCHQELDILSSKKKKPYLICEPCGMQMFIRYQSGIERLNALSERGASLLDGFVLCNKCDVAVKRKLRNIKAPLFGEAGFYCPECEELILRAPRDWRKRLEE